MQKSESREKGSARASREGICMLHSNAAVRLGAENSGLEGIRVSVTRSRLRRSFTRLMTKRLFQKEGQRCASLRTGSWSSLGSAAERPFELSQLRSQF